MTRTRPLLDSKGERWNSSSGKVLVHIERGESTRDVCRQTRLYTIESCKSRHPLSSLEQVCWNSSGGCKRVINDRARNEVDARLQGFFFCWNQINLVCHNCGRVGSKVPLMRKGSTLKSLFILNFVFLRIHLLWLGCQRQQSILPFVSRTHPMYSAI